MRLSVTLLCSLLVVAVHALKTPHGSPAAPCCAPDTMTLHQEVLSVVESRVFQAHGIHYIDLGHNARYGARVEPRNGGLVVELIIFNNNHTMYVNYPTDNYCQKITNVDPVSTCLMNHTTFDTTATIGEGMPLNIFTYLHDGNMKDYFSMTPNKCVPVQSSVMEKTTAAPGTGYSISSFYNMTEGSPDSSIFYLPPSCFTSDARHGVEDLKHLLPISTRMGRFFF